MINDKHSGLIENNREELKKDVHAKMLSSIETMEPIDLGFIIVDFKPFSKSYLSDQLNEYLSEFEDHELREFQDELEAEKQMKE